MDTKYPALPAPDSRIVYVRAVDVDSLPETLRAQIGSAKQVYAVHDAAGDRIALVRDKALAFALARQNDFAPVSVH